MKTRPLGVKIFGALFICGGIFGLAVSVPILNWAKVGSWMESLMRQTLQQLQQGAPEAQKAQFQKEEARLDELPGLIRVHSADRRGFIEPLLYLAVASCVWLVAGIGVLMLKNWARWLTLLAASGWLWFWGDGFLTERRLERVYGHQWRPHGQSQWDWLIPIGWGALLLWYFLRPSVRAQFVKRREEH